MPSVSCLSESSAQRPFSRISIEQPVSFLQPFIRGANTACVVRTCEVTRQVRAFACRLVLRGVSIS